MQLQTMQLEQSLCRKLQQKRMCDSEKIYSVAQVLSILFE